MTKSTIDLTKQIPDSKFTKELSDKSCIKIENLLKELKYNSVIWEGSVYMIPDIFMGWDTSYKESVDSLDDDSHREFTKGSPTRNKMEEILSIFIEERVEFGTEIILETGEE